jgi:hypothetical protein
MFKTYRNFHSTEEYAIACAADETRRGDPHGGWYRPCTPEEERASAEQEKVTLSHNPTAIWALATHD